VEAFITTDQFIAKAEARQKSSLFEPKYGAERALEENTFDSSKCNHAFSKTGIGGVAPFKSPVGIALYTWYRFDCM
jgi:hypothetical protein